jgi:hypothetical protein
MSEPPQGGWQPGPIPPNQGQPYGQPFDPSAYNPQQQPPPPGWQQGSWPPHPGPPPPPKGGGLKWLLIAVAVLLVIAVSIGATLLFTRDGGSGGGGSTPTSGAPSDIASANDTGPVSIITSDPTCTAYMGVNNSIARVEASGWGAQRSTLGTASLWTADQRLQVEAVTAAMLNAADQLVALAKQTPHRVMRELYEQFIAFGRAYANSVKDYTPADNGLASANVNAGSALASICNSINYGSVSRSLNAEPAPPPTQTPNLGNAEDPQRFVTSSDSTCSSWVTRLDDFNVKTSEWASTDSNVPGSQWTPERRAIQEAVEPLLSAYADDIQFAGQQSSNPVLEDFALTAALYIRTYVTVGDSYTSADGWLGDAGFRIANVVSGACRAVGG